uniref:Uncharacterized protein n=1 Tax=Globisporangium ultimum (strain ATCC 200006 / CBS 805.95 / DAOM BR144) TaxID=431595 RepID=K3X742_GLOUD
MGFRHLVPLLWDNARTIGINLLGVGDLKILNRDSYYEYIGALQAVKLTYEALARLCSVDDNVFFLGHSFGDHIAINFATLAAENNHSKGATHIEVCGWPRMLRWQGR